MLGDRSEPGQDYLTQRSAVVPCPLALDQLRHPPVQGGTVYFQASESIAF